MTTQALLTRRDLAALLRISTRSLDRYRSEGQVLQPLPGPGQPRWNAEEVLNWIRAGRPPAATWQRLRTRRR